MTFVRFKHDVSMLVRDGRLDFYTRDGGHDWFALDSASATSQAVQLDEGLVHIATVDGVYQIESNATTLFTIQKIKGF